MSAEPNPRTLTEDAYLAIERLAEIKSEFFDGKMFAMSGASPRHNLIAGNLFAFLHGSLRRKKGCTVFFADVRVKVSQTGLYTYPDLAALCGPPEYSDSHGDTLTNPSLIVEVLSKSTEGYDRGLKFENYRTIPTLRDYLLLNQDRVHADLFTRQPDTETWLLTEFKDLTASINLPSLDLTVPLATIYEGL